MSVAEAQDDLELKQAVAVYLLAITDFIVSKFPTHFLASKLVFHIFCGSGILLLIYRQMYAQYWYWFLYSNLIY